MCFSTTNTSQIPWNFKAAEGRWTELRQALSRLSPWLSEKLPVIRWDCWHFSWNSVHSLWEILESSSWSPEAAAQSRLPQTQTSLSLKAPEWGRKHSFDFPATAEPEAELQTSLLLLLLPIWQHFTCSRNPECNETTVAKLKLAMEKAAPAQGGCAGSVLKTFKICKHTALCWTAPDTNPLCPDKESMDARAAESPHKHFHFKPV